MSRYHVIPRKFYIQNWTNFRYRWSRGPEKPGGFSIWCLYSDWLIYLGSFEEFLGSFGGVFTTFKCSFFLHHIKNPSEGSHNGSLSEFSISIRCQPSPDGPDFELTWSIALTTRYVYIQNWPKWRKWCPKMTDLYKELNKNALIKF